ncbi:MAG: hypothetical protein KGJ62_03060 [Armatimonadetes bacterium]|nr:hypothetical protein [Armatimonadota bacterium]MDE2207191.1 hypothetical protein [Armatimonadota bacterium]
MVIGLTGMYDLISGSGRPNGRPPSNLHGDAEQPSVRTRRHAALAGGLVCRTGEPSFRVSYRRLLVPMAGLITGILAWVQVLYPMPLYVVGIGLAAGALLIPGFALITQKQQNTYPHKRAWLDYEVSVITYRALVAIGKVLVMADAAAGQHGGGDAG